MNISQVQCPECEKIIPIPPPYDSRNVAMLCKHCGNSFTASLLGHINQEETQMATSKKAAKAATKPASKPATKPTAPKATPKAKAEPGHKGHRKGSNLETLHVWLDKQKNQPDFKTFNEKADSLGLAVATARRQFGLFKKAK